MRAPLGHCPEMRLPTPNLLPKISQNDQTVLEIFKFEFREYIYFSQHPVEPSAEKIVRVSVCPFQSSLSYHH